MKKKTLEWKSLAGSGLFLLLALYIILAKPLSPGLSETGQLVIGGLLISIGIWIFKPFGLSFSMGGAFLAFFLLLCGLPPAVVFSGFTQPALWTLIPALFFGFVLQKTGLGRRVALAIIKLFRPTYPSMILAWVIIGVVLSVLTPSITVRVAIVMPIVVHCCELFQLEKGSKGNSLLQLVAFSMALLPGTGWLNGALWGSIIQGMVHAVPGMEGTITFSSWSNAVFLPMELATLILVIGGYLTLKPDRPLSPDAIVRLKAQKSEPMSFQEKVVGITLVAVFTLFATNSLHGIPDAAICLLALVVFSAAGVMDTKDFSSGISWDLVIFIGVALGLGSVFSNTGISAWMSGLIVTAMEPLTASPWVFVFAVAILMFIWRFVDVAILIPTMAILTPVLPAVAEAYGISPLVWVTFFLMCGNSFFMAYQNMWALMSQSMTGERGWTGKHLGVYGVVYFVACLIALAAAVPYWIGRGLL